MFYDQRQLELCVFSYMAVELRSGDLAVTGSVQYADIRDQMLTWAECQPLLDQLQDTAINSPSFPKIEIIFAMI